MDSHHPRSHKRHHASCNSHRSGASHHTAYLYKQQVSGLSGWTHRYLDLAILASIQRALARVPPEREDTVLSRTL